MFGEPKRKSLKAKDLNEMSNDELREILDTERKTKMVLDAQNAQAPESLMSGAMRKNRKTIARILTILTRRGVSCR